MNNRATRESLFSILCMLAAMTALAILLCLITVILCNGIQAINPEFLFTMSGNFGAGGGILYQILGSLLLVITAAVIVTPIAVGTALFKSEYLRHPAMKHLCSTLIYGLNGVPSIIFGIFGLVFFVHFLGMGISWLAGAVILAFMILPTVTLAAYLSMNSIPDIYRESAAALGLPRWRIIIKVILPQGFHGAISGLLLGLGRAIGETAPIMFVATAFSGVTLPSSLLEPVATLPTHILALSQQATDPRALTNAWGASLVLIALVSTFSISAFFARLKFSRASTR